jgi:uncharacterized RDD family membrane protein YckC
MESAYSSPEDQTALGTELEGLLNEAPVPASSGVRFLNYLIDRVVLYFIVTSIERAILPLLLTPPRVAFDIYYWTYLGAAYLGVAMLDTLYYTVLEGTTGRTLGKLITNTRVVRDDGSPLTMKDTLYRSLSRLVPFEAFSGFGVPWHDRWTQTTVTSNRKY